MTQSSIPDLGNIVEMTCAEAFLRAAAACGISVVFDYPGGAQLLLNDNLGRLVKEGLLKRYRTRHEQQAGHMAEGYNGASGDIAMVLATSGPGATNIITPVADAKMDSFGLLAVTGQVATTAIGTDAFQEAPVANLMYPLTKWNTMLLSTSDVLSAVQFGARYARDGRQGPVSIDFPKDIAAQKISVDITQLGKIPDTQKKHIPHVPALNGLDEVLDWISKAERPAFYIGGGVISGNASEELTMLAHALEIPVFTTLKGLGAYPADWNDTLWMGMTGMHGTVAANYALHRADLLLAFGARFDDRVVGDPQRFAPQAKIVHVDIDDVELGKVFHSGDKSRPPMKHIHADVKYVLSELLSAYDTGKLYRGDYLNWRQYLGDKKQKYPIAYTPDSRGILPQQVIATIYELAHELGYDDAIITTGVGQHQMFAAQYFSLQKPRSFITSGGLGTMGFGMPAAVGAQIARPNALVVCIDGDGSNEMTFQSLATMADYDGIPVKTVIINDSRLGMVTQWQDGFYDGRHSGSINNPPDFVKIADAYGVEGRRVTADDREHLKLILKEALTTEGPYLLDVACLHTEVYPFIPSGGSLNDLIIGPNNRKVQ